MKKFLMRLWYTPWGYEQKLYEQEVEKRGQMPKSKKEIALEWLEEGHAWAQTRIEAGDLDFDDKVYRTHAATEILLSLWDDREIG